MSSSPVVDLRTLRYQAAWARLVKAGPATWEKDLQGLPLAIRQQGLAPMIALMLGQRGKVADIADAIGSWLLDAHPGAPLLALPKGGGDRSRARTLLAAVVGSDDIVAVAAATDEAIEFAAALKRLAV